MNNMENNFDYKENLNIVSNYLKEAMLYGLETEVVTSALTILKEDPEYSIEDAMRLAMKEWDIR